jgi:hypothetical protein
VTANGLPSIRPCIPSSLSDLFVSLSLLILLCCAALLRSHAQSLPKQILRDSLTTHQQLHPQGRQDVSAPTVTGIEGKWGQLRQYKRDDTVAPTTTGAVNNVEGNWAGFGGGRNYVKRDVDDDDAATSATPPAASDVEGNWGYLRNWKRDDDHEHEHGQGHDADDHEHDDGQDHGQGADGTEGNWGGRWRQWRRDLSSRSDDNSNPLLALIKLLLPSSSSSGNSGSSDSTTTTTTASNPPASNGEGDDGTEGNWGRGRVYKRRL